MSQPFDAVVLTLGFEPGPLIRAVASYNLKPNGSIITFTPSFSDERAENAYMELKRICDIIFKNVQLNFQKVEVDLTD
ncbi:MAG: hypothetical protein NZ896_04495, partial [Nitrososphaerales archaeon]|nr:hypothetical protein [Nitrososphaerales archaeon]